MDSHALATLLWGILAILLFALVAAIVFCEATAGIFQADACQPILDMVRRAAALFE